jgi:hypothetical protein
MTDLTKFVTDAIRTESQIDAVVTNRQELIGLLEAYVALGNVLDMVKKNVFYGKPIDTDARAELLERARQRIAVARFSAVPACKITIDPRIFHALVGINTEGVELLEAMLPAIISNEPLDAVNIFEELGDVNWYQAIAVDALEGDFDDVLVKVIAKLRARFPEKYTDEKAINRDLETERKILEGDDFHEAEEN